MKNTIEDILKNSEADTEVIAVLDGEWADPAVPQNDRVKIIKTGKALGQRGAQNLACRLSKAKYVMKVDAHCAFDKGFDRKMIEGFKQTGDNVTAVPIMRNLWAFDWKCYHCGWKKYQGPTPDKCEQCGKKDKIRRKMIWLGKSNPQSVSYCFDSEPHFQYFGEWKATETYREQLKTGFTETMSLQGSCFMTTRENYWKWDLGGESLGNWGNQGLQIACATWLSGGKCLVNHNTWYAHLFRTKPGDFGFPWPITGKEVQKTKNNVKNLFWNKKHPKQIYSVRWLVERFWPVKGWTKEDLKKLDGKHTK